MIIFYDLENEAKMISLIIPCFNEEESLPLFYPEATSVLRQMNCDYELIFVNDGSRDRTLEILKELSEKDPHVIYLSFSRNFGKEAAMYAGFCNAGGDYVAVMDADLQDPPSLLPEMLEKLDPENMTALPPDVSAVTESHLSGAFLPGNFIS